MNITEKTQAEIERIQRWRGKRALFFDTETSGLPNRYSSRLEDQPHVLQLAFIFGQIPEHGDVIIVKSKSSMLIKLPPETRVDPGAAKVHGITSDVLDMFGVPKSVAIPYFASYLEAADLVIGHNIGFDLDRMWDEFARNDELCEVMRESHSHIERECTMELTRDMCALPPTARMIRSGRTGYKSPRLGEAYEHMFDEELEGAHDALIDVEACVRIFGELISGGAHGAGG